jgi:hypothetical protein
MTLSLAGLLLIAMSFQFPVRLHWSMRRRRLRWFRQKLAIGIDEDNLSIPTGRKGAARAARVLQQGLAGGLDSLLDALHQ